MTKEEFKEKYPEIIQAYNEKLINNHCSDFFNFHNPMNYIESYLKFMRDYYLITTPEDDISEETNLKITALMTAISEYDRYKKSCEQLKELTKKEADEKELTKRLKDKDFHWNSFWKLVMLNMEDWLPYDAD